MSSLTPDMTMAAVLASYAGARRALFAKYHIGGCRSCGFADTETLAEVCARNENLPPVDVVAHLEASRELDAQMQISPAALAAALLSPTPPRLLDVRSSEEHEAVHLPGDTFMNQELMQQIDSMSQVYAIYVFSYDASRYESFASICLKVKGVYDCTDPICPSLQQTVKTSNED